MMSRKVGILCRVLCGCICSVLILFVMSSSNVGCVSGREVNQVGIKHSALSVAENKPTTFSYSYTSAVAFKAVSWEDEEVVQVVGNKTGPYEYLGCTVLVDKKSSCQVRESGGTFVEWQKPEAMRGEALCYGFRNEEGQGLIVVKRRLR